MLFREKRKDKRSLTSHASHPALTRCRALLIPASRALPRRAASLWYPARPPPLLHLSCRPPPSSSYSAEILLRRRGGAMGRRKFRLGDMMPNSWFYKLRDMRRARGRPPVVAGGGGAPSAMLPSSSSPPPRGSRPASPRRASAALPHRTSYYYPTRDRELPPAPQPRAAEEDRELLPLPESPPPTCSSRRRHRVGPVRAARGPEAVAEPHGRRRRDLYVGRGGEKEDVGEVRRAAAVTGRMEDTLGGKVIASETDIVIDLRAEGTAERVLRPIVTRPATARKVEAVRCGYEPEEDRYVYADLADTTPRASSASEQGGNKGQHHPRRLSVSAGHRLRTRANSPRLASSTTSRSRRKSKPTTPAASPRKTTTALPPPLAESFAVVKASADPRRDFRESMEEMIAEKGIRGAADLEDLLACYLALNAAEHHDLIVEVFEQIWASLAGAMTRE